MDQITENPTLSIQEVANRAVAEAPRFGLASLSSEGREKHLIRSNEMVKNDLKNSRKSPQSFAIEQARLGDINNVGVALNIAREGGQHHQNIPPELEIAILALAYENKLDTYKNIVESRDRNGIAKDIVDLRAQRDLIEDQAKMLAAASPEALHRLKQQPVRSNKLLRLLGLR